MKASELILKLQEMINKHGDCVVENLGCYDYRPIQTVLYHEKEGKELIAANHANTFSIL